MKLGVAGRLARAFLESKLTPLLVVASLALGALALLFTPREEEPQIRVPMVDIQVGYPGAEPAEVESRIVTPIEKAMWGIGGVEHVYASAHPGFALVTVRFRVNERNEESLVEVYDRMDALRGALPPGSTSPEVKLYSIDDVPFLALTLWSDRHDSDALRPVAMELAQELSEVADATRAQVIGGHPRTILVTPDPERMAGSGVTWQVLAAALGGSRRQDAGTAVAANRELRVEVGPSFAGASDVGAAVVGGGAAGPIHVRDVAEVSDGPAETTRVVRHLFGPGAEGRHSVGVEHDAVTIALAKRPGANATQLAREVLAKVEALRSRLLPSDVHVEVTRDYGETANEKSTELVEHLLIATVSVVVLISLMMGWRSGLVVGVAVPVTLALTLFVYFLFGYTLNRVTLFALIFSIGILVDDAIVVVENIERHHREKRRASLASVVVEAVDEVGNPTILATFTVIAAILPMAFVRGLMGPYMRPIPTGASAAMVFSLLVAFVVSPWAAHRIFRHTDAGHAPEGRSSAMDRAYRRGMRALILRPRVRLAFLAGVLAILAGAVALVPLGLVKVKMLPFDNKSELQVLVDHPEGTPLPVTLETARQLARHLAGVPEVKSVQLYAGAASPISFNGLVRHYFLRQLPTQADLQVNLVGKDARDVQSHDLAKRIRPALAAIAASRGAELKVIEIPPGPPVLDTLVAEIYGPTPEARRELASRIRGFFEETEDVVDVVDTLEADRRRTSISVDREKAALHGVPAASIVETLAGSGAGRSVGTLDVPQAREPVMVTLRLSPTDRSDVGRRLALRVDASRGQVALSELTRVADEPQPQVIVHKDLKPVLYVLGDLAGERESPVYALAALDEKVDGLVLPTGEKVERFAVQAPRTSDRPALKWDGEWQITYEVFRDLGIAFAIVMVLIAILVIGWFQSFDVPLAILLPIPLSLIGILPGHLAFGAFFTATSMIGFIAGAGIIVRNSIILVDFIELKVREGLELHDAVVEAGVVRFRPMLLTASAVVVGSFVILFDPIFQGLAISLMMGEVAATLLSRAAVPVVYYLLARRGRVAELRREVIAKVAVA